MSCPTIYSPALAAEIFDRMAEGVGLNEICRDANMPPVRTVRRWVIEDREGFATLYARAREAQAEHWACEIITLSDEVKDCTDNAVVQAARLRVDSRKWIASKVLPRQYGDRLAVGGDF